MSSTPPPVPVSSLQAGARLGKYVILSEIGRGGMAVVYKAHQPDLDRVVAVKVLFGALIQQRFVERFQAEARALAKLNHPGVIRIHEVGEQGGAHYLVMEYIEGIDLLSYLHRQKPSFEEVLDIVRQTAEALAYCHQQGIIHRDLKPNNILMRGQTPVLIDFGLAKPLDPDFHVTLTLSGEVVGSPAYMSPEQAQGQDVGVLSDICSLGVIMYELISFKNPYLDPRSLHQTALNAIAADPVPLRYLSPWLDPDFAAVVAKAMAKDSKTRYATMELLLQDLHAYRMGQPLLAKPPGFFKHSWRFVKSSPVLYLGAGFLLAIASVTGLFLSLEQKNKTAPFALVLEETFSNPDSLTPFASLDFDGRSATPSSSWKVADGRLEGSCPGLCGAVTDQAFFGDLKVEFTVQGLEGHNGDFNAFLFGPTPEDAFRFTLGEWGSGRAQIEVGKRARYPQEAAPVRLNGGIAYKVTLEKEGHALRLRLGDRLLVEKFYPLPVRIDRGSRLGFYTWNGGLAVDDLRIYKKAVAVAAGPTVVADAYQEEGFIRNSILAYRHVIDAYAGKPVVYEAHLKLGKSYMVMRDFGRAYQHLTLAASGSKDPAVLPEAVFQLAQCQFQYGRAPEGYEKLKLLPATYPESEFNRAVVQNRAGAVYACLDAARAPEACLPAFAEEFRFLIEHQEPYRPLVGLHHAELLELFRRLGVSKPLLNASTLLEFYAGAEEVRARIRQTLARHFAAQSDFAGAQRLLSQGRYSGLDRTILAEQVLLGAVLDLLEGRQDGARETFARAGRDFADVVGFPFRCQAHARAAGLLAQEAPRPVDNGLFVNDAVPRRERLLLAYLDGRLVDSAYRRAQPPVASEPASLEETLAECLRHVPPAPVTVHCLQEARKRFPHATFEAVYLDRILARLGRKSPG